MGKKAALLAVALAVAGLCILLWPVVSGHRLQADMSAAAVLNRMPFLAPTPLPTMMATGVARPRAQGQLMTRKVRAR